MTSAALPPLVVVIGTTGAGKTKLSVDVAEAIGGEVVNADAMQLYKGLDIATAKATADEMRGVPHHLLDCLEPERSGFTVQEYTRRAIDAIEAIHARGRVPILVGGTMYYVQSVLWDSLLQPPPPVADAAAAAAVKPMTTSTALSEADALLLAPTRLDALGSHALHTLLARLDPTMASRLHENNVRKVRQSLEVLRSSGTRHSDLMAEQQRRQAEAGPRFNALALWVRSDAATLDARLDSRVDTMVAQGVEGEVRELWRRLARATATETARATATASAAGNSEGGSSSSSSSSSSSVNATAPTDGSGSGSSGDGKNRSGRGILQAIGYKEFAPLFEDEFAVEAAEDEEAEGGASLRSRDGASLERARLRELCVLNLKASTRRYARKQLRWIRNRFVGRDVPTLPVDSSDASRWSEVTAPAIDAVRGWLRGEALPHDAIMPGSCDRFVCEHCNGRVLLGDVEWSAHRESREHLKAKRRSRKRQRSDAAPPPLAAAGAPASGKAAAEREK